MPLPQETIDKCLDSTPCCLARSGRKMGQPARAPAPGSRLWGLRAALGLFANLRPAKIYVAAEGRLAAARRDYRGQYGHYGGAGATGGDLFRQARRETVDGGPKRRFDTEYYTRRRGRADSAGGF